MNREECIKAIHEAELKRHYDASMKLFGLGLISSRIYQHIKRDAQRERENVGKVQKDGAVSQTAGSVLDLAARPQDDTHADDEAAEGG